MNEWLCKTLRYSAYHLLDCRTHRELISPLCVSSYWYKATLILKIDTLLWSSVSAPSNTVRLTCWYVRLQHAAHIVWRLQIAKWSWITFQFTLGKKGIMSFLVVMEMRCLSLRHWIVESGALMVWVDNSVTCIQKLRESRVKAVCCHSPYVRVCFHPLILDCPKGCVVYE